MPNDSPEIQCQVQQAGQTLRDQLLTIWPRAISDSRPAETYPFLEQALDECLKSLSATGLWGADNRAASAELWKIVGDLLEVGWLQYQARHKPRGYAGDYELLSRIWRSEVCDHPLGRHFDRYFQAQAAPRAVRNRMRMTADWIVEGVQSSTAEFRVAIVGCGPGLEVVYAAEQLSNLERSRLSLTLLDLDPAAVDFAKQALAPYFAADQLHCEQGNLFRLPKKQELAGRLNNADQIICTGLFDYFPDELAATMLRTFWTRLAPGGSLRVFNFALHPTRAYLEWLGNWYLLYRTAADLRGLAEAAGVPDGAVNTGSEALGIDLLVSATKG